MSPSPGRTVSHARVYALGAVLRNVISFIMLPIYTRHLAPEDYGTIELLSMLLDIVGLIVGLRVEDAIFRYWHDARTDSERTAVVSNALVAAVTANLVGTVFIVLLSKPLSVLMFGQSADYKLTALFGITLTFQALIFVPLAYVRLQQRPWLYLGISVAKLVLQLALNIYFVVYRDMKVDGVVYSAVASTLVAGLVAVIYLLRHVRFEIDKPLMRKMLRFSAPLILASIGAFYSAYGDRYFLRIYSGLAEVGIYALAYKFGFLLMTLVWESFTKIWDVRRYEILHGDDSGETYDDNFVVMIGAMILGALGISVFVGELLRVMSSPQYWSAAIVAPVILLAYVIQALMNFNSFPIYARGDTKDIARGHWVCVVVITIGYMGLIPRFGMHGAAWATVIGFLSNMIWVVWKGRSLLDMQLSWSLVGTLLAVASILYLSSTLVVGSIVPGVFLKAALVMIYVAVFWLLATQKQRQIVLAFVRR